MSARGMRTWTVSAALACAVLGGICLVSEFLGSRVVGFEPILGESTTSIGKLALALSALALWLHKMSPAEAAMNPPPIAERSAGRAVQKGAAGPVWHLVFSFCGALTILLGITLVAFALDKTEDSSPLRSSLLGWGALFAGVSAIRVLSVAAVSTSRDAGRWPDFAATTLAAMTIVGSISLLAFPGATQAVLIRGPLWITVACAGCCVGTGAFVAMRGAGRALSSSHPARRIDFRRVSRRRHV